MKVMTLDPKRTHEHNPNCPMRLVQAPDGYGKSGWLCVDCGCYILHTLIEVMPVPDPPISPLWSEKEIEDERGKMNAEKIAQDFVEGGALGFGVNVKK